MFKAFFKSKQWALWAYLGGALLFLVVLTQVWIATQINVWYGEFYNILQQAQQHKLSDFYDSMIKFSYLAFPAVIIGTFANYFTRVYALKWREAMTFYYLPKWRNAKGNIEGSSQRIQEDIFRFARIVESLGLQALKAILTLIAFIPILYGLSKHVNLPVMTFLNDIDGVLVYISLLISIGGMVISWYVGIYLPKLEYNNQKVEAAFRKELVYAEDNKKSYGGDETIFELFTGIKYNYHRLYLHYGYFDLWVILYAQFMIIAPYLIMAPSLFTGAMALGVLIQTSNAFGKVNDSFSLLINNWTTITELRSVRLRLVEFEKHIDMNTK
ncbi:MAG: putative transporter [Alphaproteobacteria bacterium]